MAAKDSFLDSHKKFQLIDRPFAIVDLETTGLNPQEHEIIEIGLVLVEQRTLRTLDRFESKVKPLWPERISPIAQKLNGYNDADWIGAPPLRQVLADFAERTKDAMLYSWNVSFDWPFLQRAFYINADIKNQMDYHRLCLMSQAQFVLRDKGLTSMSQDAVAKFLGVEPEPAVHRAINGADLSLRILKKMNAL
jgi:DNA polymerase-3 subunit alpha (Gram-positive type)